MPTWFDYPLAIMAALIAGLMLGIVCSLFD